MIRTYEEWPKVPARDSALQGRVSRGVTLDCSSEQAYQPLSSQVNSNRVDDIDDDVEICSRGTIVFHNREPRQSKELYRLTSMAGPKSSVLFISEAERKGRNENPDLIKWHSNSIFEKCPLSIPHRQRRWWYAIVDRGDQNGVIEKTG